MWYFILLQPLILNSTEDKTKSMIPNSNQKHGYPCFSKLCSLFQFLFLPFVFEYLITVSALAGTWLMRLLLFCFTLCCKGMLTFWSMSWCELIWIHWYGPAAYHVIEKREKEKAIFFVAKDSLRYILFFWHVDQWSFTNFLFHVILDESRFCL